MRILLISFLFGFTYLFPISLFSQSTNSNTSTIPIYTSKLFERQLIQYAYDGSPNPKTGVFSGVVTNYHLDNEYGFADFRLNTYSAPKPTIYSFIILSTTELISNPLFDKKFRDDLVSIWISFSHTYKKDKNQKINIIDRNQYIKLLDSLNSKINPYYSFINSIGARILDSIQSTYSSVSFSKSHIVRNTKVPKLEANKFWETSFSLFDAYDDKLISLELSNPPVYNLYIHRETDNIDSLINLRTLDIENNYNSTYRNNSFTPNQLSTNNGIKFRNFENLFKWIKLKYPEKFSITNTNNVSTPQKIQPSENKSLEAFVGLLAGLAKDSKFKPTRNNQTNTYNFSNSKNNKTCYSCNGSGKCSVCSKSFKKPYYTGNGGYQWRNESRPGLVLCNDCSGRGHQQQKSSRGGWEPSGKCYVRICQDGWVPCKECNPSGNGRNIGNCKNCNGTGSK
jgi:hypothetical protein